MRNYPVASARGAVMALAGIALFGIAAAADAQWAAQQSGTRASLRGLSVVNERIVWASGSGGTFVRTVDAGLTWMADTVPGATRLDFRDVQAFSADTAVLLSSGENDVQIFRTTNGGRSWTLAYSSQGPGVFFDGMAFWDPLTGIAFGDPVNGQFAVIMTTDGGASWKEMDRNLLPRALEGEAAFAASGTSIATAGRSHVWIGTGGGPRARVFHSSNRGGSWQVFDVGMASGNAGGIYSLAFADSLRGVAVGGNYTQAASTAGVAAFSNDGGRMWTALTADSPHGYRSGVALVPGTPAPTAIAVGPNGTDYSVDMGRTWASLSNDNFNAVAFASPAAGWAVGGGGRIAKFSGAVPTTRR